MKRKKEIYVVTQYSFEYQDTLLFATGFYDKEKAIEFVKSKMTLEDIEKDEIHKRRKLKAWNEFTTDKYCFNIKVIDLV